TCALPISRGIFDFDVLHRTSRELDSDPEKAVFLLLLLPGWNGPESRLCVRFSIQSGEDPLGPLGISRACLRIVHLLFPDSLGDQDPCGEFQGLYVVQQLDLSFAIVFTRADFLSFTTFAWRSSSRSVIAPQALAVVNR